MDGSIVTDFAAIARRLREIKPEPVKESEQNLNGELDILSAAGLPFEEDPENPLGYMYCLVH